MDIRIRITNKNEEVKFGLKCFSLSGEHPLDNHQETCYFLTTDSLFRFSESQNAFNTSSKHLLSVCVCRSFACSDTCADAEHTYIISTLLK